jgi:hypothetical protein
MPMNKKEKKIDVCQLAANANQSNINALKSAPILTKYQ